MSKATVTFVWLVVLAAWFGLYRFLRYNVDMYYSKLAAKQFGDDSAYAELKFHNSADNIVLLVFLAGLGFCVYRIVRVWTRQKQPVANK